MENFCVIKSHTVSTDYFQFLLKLVINQDKCILISLLHENNGRWLAGYRDDLKREQAPVNQRQTMGDKKTRPTNAMLLSWLRIFFWYTLHVLIILVTFLFKFSSFLHSTF